MISSTLFSQSRNAISRKLGSLTRANQITSLKDAFALLMLIWYVLLLGMLKNQFFFSWLLVLSDIWFSLNLALYRKIKNITRVNRKTHTYKPFILEQIYSNLILFHLGAAYFWSVFQKEKLLFTTELVRAYSPISQNKVGNLDKENG